VCISVLMSANSRTSAFHEIAGHRERSAGEADERRVGRFEFFHHSVDGLGHVRESTSSVREDALNPRRW